MCVLYILILRIFSKYESQFDSLRHERCFEAMLLCHLIYDFGQRLFLVQLSDQYSMSGPVLLGGPATPIGIRCGRWKSDRVWEPWRSCHRMGMRVQAV